MFLQVSSRGQYASPDQDGGCIEHDVQEMDDEEMNRINATVSNSSFYHVSHVSFIASA